MKNMPRNTLFIIISPLLILFFLYSLVGYVWAIEREGKEESAFLSVKKEPLPLVLLGTIIEADPQKSSAVIFNQNTQRQEIFKVSDKVLDYQIFKILRGTVVLKKDWKTVYLSLPEGSIYEPITIISEAERIINRNALAKRICSPHVALQYASIVPYVEKGKIIGFMISKLKDKELAALAGIREGDIVIGVNGEKLNSIRKTLDVYLKVRTQEKVMVEFRRGAEVKNLLYYLN